VTDRPAAPSPSTLDAAALAALVWVVSAALHEGLGHGAACAALGGDPTSWSTFHFGCARGSMSLGDHRLVSAAGTAVNMALAVIGYAWWRGAERPLASTAAWTLFVVNALTSFGYLVFSAALGVGDWNTAGVMVGVPDPLRSRLLPGVVGVVGYYAVIRLAASMMARQTDGAVTRLEARRLCVVVWLSVGAVSLLAGAAAGAGWQATLGAALGAALGGNAGLLSVPRLVPPGRAGNVAGRTRCPLLWTAAAIAVAAFVIVLGPGVPL